MLPTLFRFVIGKKLKIVVCNDQSMKGKIVFTIYATILHSDEHRKAPSNTCHMNSSVKGRMENKNRDSDENMNSTYKGSDNQIYPADPYTVLQKERSNRHCSSMTDCNQ
jgi:hypothetical protein